MTIPTKRIYRLTDQLLRTLMLTGVILGLFLLTAAPSAAVAVEIPKTGQTTCFDQTGNIIDCTATGQDGDVQVGLGWPEPRFEDVGDGTMIDRLTGLMWLKDANCAQTAGYSPNGSSRSAMTWVHAMDFVSQINAGTHGLCGAGHADWRAPNVNELESLVYSGPVRTSEWLTANGFTNVQAYHYWTSTLSLYSTDPTAYDRANIINLRDGSTGGTWRNRTSMLNYILPVRGVSTGPSQVSKTGQTVCYATDGSVIDCGGTGQDAETRAGAPWPEPRFHDNGDGTVLDRLTGLAWLKDGDCLGMHTWMDAIATVEDLNSAPSGFSCLDYAGQSADWRTPTRKELRSLIDYSRFTPALAANHPFDIKPTGIYWTSTSEGEYETPDEYAGAAGVGLRDGLLFNYTKSGSMNILPVRTATFDIAALAAAFGNPDCGGCHEDLNEDDDLDGSDLVEIAGMM